MLHSHHIVMQRLLNHANFCFQDKRLKSICWVHAIRLLFFFIHVYPKLVPLHTILRSGWILVLRGTEPEGWNKWSCIWSFSWSSPKPYNRLMRDSLFFLWPVTPFYWHDNSKRSQNVLVQRGIEFCALWQLELSPCLDFNLRQSVCCCCCRLQTEILLL